MHPDFELSTGLTIDRPWLRLRASSPDNDHIGLGAMKCRAICALEKELNRWLLKQRVFKLEERLTHLMRKRE